METAREERVDEKPRLTPRQLRDVADAVALPVGTRVPGLLCTLGGPVGSGEEVDLPRMLSRTGSSFDVHAGDPSILGDIPLPLIQEVGNDIYAFYTPPGGGCSGASGHVHDTSLIAGVQRFGGARRDCAPSRPRGHSR